MKRIKLSEEHKQKISLSNIGKKRSLETRLRISLSHKGLHPVNEFKKGHIPANKGKRQPNFSGLNHPNWKGDEVGYHALHAWVNRHKGKATICAECNSVKNVMWANKSHKYKRDLSDFIPLCAKCHRNYDGYLGKNLTQSHKDKIRKGVTKNVICSVCDKKHCAKGLCVMHYKRMRQLLAGKTYKAVIK